MRQLGARIGLLVMFLGVGASLSQTTAERDGSADKTGTFSDITQDIGIPFQHKASHTSQKYLLETMGAGVAWLDYDNDGLLDLFYVNGARLSDPMLEDDKPAKSEPEFWNRLYRNTGTAGFEDVTEAAGVQGKVYSMGVAAGDYDNDGDTDLFLTGFGRNELYRNTGNATFEDVTTAAGVAGGGWSTGAGFLDYNRDGHLDLLVARYLLDWDFDNNPWCGHREVDKRGYCHPNAFRSVTHLLYRNNGDGSFRDVSRESRIIEHPGKGLGVAVNDYDRDGWPDFIIANDQVAQQFFHNNADGTFSETALEIGLAYNTDGRAFAGMGVDFTDYTNDGWPDLFINALSLEGYVLFENDEGFFLDVSHKSGLLPISRPYGGWGAKLFDIDNDGWKDLFVAQSHVMDTISMDHPEISYEQPFLLAKNERGRLDDISEQGGPAFQKLYAARGAAFGDYDNDGDIDIAVSVNDGRAVLLRNNGAPNHWLLIQTVGTQSNRDGIGAKVRVLAESGREQFGFVSTTGSYLSSNDKRVHFGLGRDNKVSELEIRWPSGTIQLLRGLEANSIVTVREPTARE